MTEKLKTYLRLLLSHDSPGETKRIVESIPKEWATRHMGKTVRVRELLSNESVQATNVVPTEVLNTIIEGSEPFKCVRQVFPMYAMHSNSMTVPKGAAGAYADDVAEGAEIPVKEQAYSKMSLTTKKIGVRPLITNEMIEDAQIDVIAEEIAYAGQRLENKFNQDVFSAILANSTSEYDANNTAANQGLNSIGQGIGVLKKAGYMPDKLVMGPDFEAKLLTQFVPSNYWGGDKVINGGVAGIKSDIIGLTPYVYSGTYTGGTYTYRYTTDNDIGGIIVSSKQSGGIGMRRDISMEKYNDPARDLLGLSCTMRYAYNYAFADATCRMKY